MIQIVAQRVFGNSPRPVFVYTEPVILLPSLTAVFVKYADVLAQLPEEERLNLFYCLAHHSGVTGASKPQRSNSTFEYQTALAFDIDKDDSDGSAPDTTRWIEYATCAGEVLEATTEAFTIIISGNGLHLIWGLRHPIRTVAYFEDERESYKELIKKLKAKFLARGLGGAADPKIFDGARVLRLPGSRNTKPGRADTVCTLVQVSKTQLETDLFKLSGLKSRERDNISPAEIKRSYPAPDFAEMVRECEFVKWTYSSPEKVHEPQAFDLFSLLAPQSPDARASTPWGEIGAKDFGRMVFEKATSSASLKREDFESKWKQAKEYGGRKCQTIANSMIGICESCKHWQKIPSPLALKSAGHISSESNGFWVLDSKAHYKHPHYEDLAKVFRSEKEYIVTPDARIMVFNGKFYEEFQELAVKAWIETKIKPSEPLRESMRQEFLHKIRSRVGAHGLASDEFFELTTKGRLNCANGILQIDEGRLLQHSADYGFLYALPYAIDLEAEGSEVFLDWLGTITEDRTELMEALLDLMAYILWPGYDDHLFAYFVGIGANGKSTLIHVIQALVGQDNYSTVGIQQLGTNRFAPAQLEGKLVNLSEESSGGGHEMDFEAMNIIKTLSAGGTMMVEKKGQDGYSFTNKAKLIFSANQAPRFKETGHAIQRRILAIPFDHLIQSPDSGIEKQLISEVPRIAAMLIRRIQQKIIAEGRFTVNRGGQTAAHTAKKIFHGQNTVVEWGEEMLESKVELGKDCYLACDEAYQHYRIWCESNGFNKPMSKPSFGKILGAMILTPAAQGGAEVIRAGGKVLRVYRYTQFKEGAETYGPGLKQ